MRKSILIISLTTLITAFVEGKGQGTANWQWAIGAGGLSADYTRGIVADSAGNVYATGQYTDATLTFGSTSITNSHNGFTDGYLVKYSSSGNCLWAKDIGGQIHDNGSCVAIDRRGNGSNVLIAGSFSSSSIVFGTTTLTNSSSAYDVFVVKYDNSGNVLWAVSGGGSGQDSPTSIATDANGNTYVTGSFNSPSITFGSILLTNSTANYYDVFLVKFDVNGNVVWAKNGNGMKNEASYAVVTDINGNVYFAGTYDSTSVSFGSTVLTNAGTGSSRDIFLVKYDSLGNVQWGKSIGASGNEVVNGIAVDLTGNLYLTGSFTSSTLTIGSNTLLNAGTFHLPDILIAKFNTLNGNAIWAKEVNGNMSDEGTSIGVDAVGNIYVAGYYQSDTINLGQNILINTNSGNLQQDLFLAKYDGLGNMVWSIGKDAPAGGAVKISVAGNDLLYAGGQYSSNSINFSSSTITNHGNYDIYIAKLNGVTQGLNEILDNKGFVLFPNPVNSELNLMSVDFQIKQVYIYNVLGELVYSEKEKKGSRKVDISGLTNGYYLVKVLDEKGNNIVKRFVKE